MLKFFSRFLLHSFVLLNSVEIRKFYSKGALTKVVVVGVLKLRYPHYNNINSFCFIIYRVTNVPKLSVLIMFRIYGMYTVWWKSIFVDCLIEIPRVWAAKMNTRHQKQFSKLINNNECRVHLFSSKPLNNILTKLPLSSKVVVVPNFCRIWSNALKPLILDVTTRNWI